MRRFAVAAGLAVAATSPARADDAPPARPAHGSVGAGTALVLTGDGGDRNRFDAELELEPGGRFGRYGALLAIHGFDGDHAGLVVGGIVLEAAASRPRLVLALHGDAGVDLDARRPVVGGGLRATLGVVGPFGFGLDTTALLVADGIDGTRLQISGDAMVVVRW